MLYKYRSLNNFKYFVDILVNKRLYASNYKDLNDPMEGVYQYSKGIPRSFIDKIKSKKNKVRIVSLSRKNDISLMWSHYADGHKGIVLGVEIDKEKYDLRPIEYLRDTYTLENGWMPSKVEYNERIKSTEVGLACGILTKKNKIWEYEQEERIITKDGSKYVDVSILEIILGKRMSPENVKLIKNFVNKIDESINIKKADNLHFDLSIDKID